MGKTSKIEWTDSTWNPWVGCHKVSPACDHCYMYRDQARFGNDPSVVRKTGTATFDAPLRWKDGRKIFTCSWSDFFIEEADDWRPAAWDIIRMTPQHTYMILTKRPERVFQCLPGDWEGGWPWVWLGVTTENQEWFDIRYPELLKILASVHFISAEPLLGPIDLGDYPVDWVIAGGESGAHARLTHPYWARRLLHDCVGNGIPYFFKGWGQKDTGCMLDGQEWKQFPHGH